MTTRLIIARHGNTFGPGDVITRVGGRTDLPLVESGLAQGTRLGLHLKEHNLIPSTIWTSNLLRTKQTAQKACEAAQISPVMLEDPLFNEIDYGPDENRPEEEVVARLGEAALKAWDQDAIVPDGWRVDVQAIIDGWHAFAEKVARDYEGQTVMAVTSNGVARFSPYLTGDFEGFRQQYKIKISTGAFCLFTQEKGDTNWKVESWNTKPSGVAPGPSV